MNEQTPRNRAERRAATRSGRSRAAGAALTATKVGALVATSAAAAFVGGATPAGAASTFTVSNTNASGSGSLAKAIIDANFNAGADIINFTAGLTGTINAGARMNITDSVTINGPGASAITVSGGGSHGVFYLKDSASTIDVTISGLTLADGNQSQGGEIWNHGNEHLTVTDSVLTGGLVKNWGGAISADVSGNTLNVTNSEITGNTAQAGGGGVYVNGSTAVSFSNSSVSGNTSSGNGGGGLYANTIDGLTITDSHFDNNTAKGGHKDEGEKS